MRPALPDSAAMTPAVAGAILLTLAASVTLTGHDGLRAARVLALMVPLFIWLRWPVQHPGWKALRLVVVSAMLCLFVLDGVVRTYIQSRYQAVPESAMVLAALANTSSREATEYAQSMGHTLWLGLLGSAVILCVVITLTTLSNRHHAPVGKAGRWALIVLLVLCSVGLLSKHWRRYHPAIYWSNWATSITDLRSSLSNQDDERAQLMANAEAAKPWITSRGPSTVVLVITDSVNRDNMSVYGYERETTPELTAFSREEAARWLTLSYAWSAEPGTLASLSGIFSYGMRGQNDPVGKHHHVLAMARAAGYRIWWMSNHDDIAIDQQHARLAHTVEMINRQPGRGSASLDGELLDCLEEALVDPTQRKLIVVHLLGAHPDYSRRAPEGMRPFDAGNDAVEAEMVSEGRSRWVREMRQTYDAAIRYHDGVVTQTARLTRRHAPANGQAAWMYLSDHGQEVGHNANRTGHSAATEAGYRIPALVWRSSPSVPAEASKRPFRADWAGWLLADLMNVRWDAMERSRNVLDETYAWEPPALPLKDVDFHR